MSFAFTSDILIKKQEVFTMSKFHINTQGLIAPCTATVQACPFGDGAHFGSETAANNALNRVMSKVTGDSTRPLTDKEYDIARVVKVYEKPMLRAMLQREDMELIKDYIDSDDFSTEGYVLLAHDKNSHKLIDANLERVLEVADKHPLTTRDMRWAADAFNASQARNGDSHTDRLKGTGQLLSYMAQAESEQGGDELVEYVLDRSQPLAEAAEYAIPSLSSDGAISMHQLLQYTNNIPQHHAQQHPTLMYLDDKSSERVYQATGKFSLLNKNLNSNVIADIAKSDDNVMRLGYKAIYNHPNINHNTADDLARRFPAEYTYQVNYANTGKGASELLKDIATDSSHQSTRRGRNTSTYTLDTSKVAQYNLNEEQLGNIMRVPLVHSSYNESTGLLTIEYDSGD